MSLRANIQGIELQLEDFKLSYQSGKIPTFSFSIEARHFPSRNELLLADVVVYQDNLELIRGLISELPKPDIIDNVHGFLKITCDNALGYLYLEMPLQAQFQNVTISTAIINLLANTLDSTWSLNDTTTLSDDTLTVDLRNRETLWAQMEMLRDEARQPFYFRYAGISGTTHLLDIGSFGVNLNDVYARQGANVVDAPRYSQPSILPIKVLRPVSGKVNGKPVDLSEALNIDANLATDVDYPLNASTQSVENNTINNGRRLRKAYTAIKTQNNSVATQAEINQVALALYYRARRDIEASTPYETIRVDVLLANLPSIYDQIYVDLTVEVAHYDDLSATLEKSVPIQMQGWYRIIGIHQRGKDWVARQAALLGTIITGNVYELELSNGAEIDEYDEAALVLEKTRSNDLEDNENVISGSLGQTAVVLNHNTIAADCNYSGANTGKEFIFPLPTIPAGATAVSTQITAIDPSTADTVVLQAATLVDNLELCVSGAAAAPWTTADDVTVTVVYTFT